MKKILTLFLTCMLCFAMVACDKDKPVTPTPTPTPTPEPIVITVSISGAVEVKSGAEVAYTATVTGTTNTSVDWSIKEGNSSATIDQNGILKAKNVTEDKVITIVATSLADATAVAEQSVIIKGKVKPVLTQGMLDELKTDKISFDGYVRINLYEYGLFEKYYNSYQSSVATAMDGTNWYSSYQEVNSGAQVGLYYKKHNDMACQVGLNFYNEEIYEPMIDDNGRDISWEDSGLYNNFMELTIDDFTFNDDLDAWRWEYTGSDSKLNDRVVASANPYNFNPISFGLIIEDGEIMGIYSISEPDYSIQVGYKAIQELIVLVTLGDVVDVPTVNKFNRSPDHDALATAIENMQNLDSYDVDFHEITASPYFPDPTEAGFNETITNDICHFVPYSISYDKTTEEEIHTPDPASAYGYKKINNNLYNMYQKNQNGTYSGNRAYADDFSSARPTFAFAPEIFNYCEKDEEAGTLTYYVADVMSSVASTFYKGVGNDIGLYGIFATRGVVSETYSFTPYVVVKDGYIIEAAFYFNIGTLYGVIEIEYSNFNTATLPSDLNVEFETRNVPSSWSELTIQVSDESSSTAEDYTMNALEYFKEFYNNDDIESTMPFFGIPLGDTYGFGLTTIYIPIGTKDARRAVVLYYDVPLDMNYTITSSLKLVEDYLLSLGFVKNANGEFSKGDICVAPTDSSLDLMIYIWKK